MVQEEFDWKAAAADFFDEATPTAEAAREQGQEVAAEHRAASLGRAQVIAVKLGRLLEEVTADEVYRELDQVDVIRLGPAAGAIFRSPGWRWTGRWKKSTRVSNHGRMVRVWTLQK